MSLADASFETWVDGYDQATPARKVSIYNEGFLIAWMIDMRLRLISDGNLSHLMYVFNKRFGNLQKGYHTRTLFDLIKELYAVSLDSIFEKFILKKACYFEEIRNLANNFGLTITLEKASFSARYLGFKINETEKGFFVLQVYPESLADRFGIKPGIEISHCNNLVIQDLLQTEFYPTTHFSIIFSPNKEIQFDLDSLQKTYFEMVEVKKKEVE
jgi:predicted metalloprotease with PDZ domain